MVGEAKPLPQQPLAGLRSPPAVSAVQPEAEGAAGLPAACPAPPAVAQPPHPDFWGWCFPLLTGPAGFYLPWAWR